MSVLLASNNKLHWGNDPANDTNTSHFDSDNVNYAVTLIDDLIVGALDSHLAPGSDTVYYQFDYYLGAGVGNGEDGYYCRIYDASDNVIAEINLTNGYVRAKVFGDSTEVGPSPSRLGGVLINKIQVKLVVNATGITMDVLSGGVLLSTATALNTGGVGVADRFDFNSNDAMGFGDNAFSQFVASDIDLGNKGFTKLSPASAGTDSNLAGSYTTLIDDDSATGMSGTVAGNKSSFNMDTYSGGDLIHSYVVTAVVNAGAGAPGNFRFYLIIGGVHYYGSTQPIAADTSIIAQEEWASDPSGGSWTEAKINAAQPGFELVA